MFACWATNKTLDQSFLAEFNAALKTGVDNIDEVVKTMGQKGSITGNVLKQYLTENIDFNLSEEKKKGLEKFLTFVKNLDN